MKQLAFQSAEEAEMLFWETQCRHELLTPNHLAHGLFNCFSVMDDVDRRGGDQTWAMNGLAVVPLQTVSFSSPLAPNRCQPAHPALSTSNASNGAPLEPRQLLRSSKLI